MKATQQRFWPDAQPLVERLGRDFFRRLPETAGVYQMRGESDTVLQGLAKIKKHDRCHRQRQKRTGGERGIRTHGSYPKFTIVQKALFYRVLHDLEAL
jgi:hypothetical protein